MVQILEKEGITAAFGIPGAGINPVYKYLGQSEKIKHYLMRHEEAAVHAADGFYRASGKMALAICTSGPAATNFITGLYTANIDSIPLIAITGQNVTSLLGKDAFQCVDIARMAAPVSKKTWCVTDAAEIPAVFREAFHTAREGKPGPVLIDLPLDIQKIDIPYDMGSYTPAPVMVPGPDSSAVAEAIDLLDKARNPVMIMGGGVILSGAEQECTAFAEYMQLPVITTYMAKGGIPEDHPLNAQHMGIQVGASTIGNRVFLESDVVIGVGCRFTDRHTGDLKVYQGDRKFIHINIEPKEIGKILKADVGIAADAKKALEALLAEAVKRGPRRKGSPRVAGLPELRKAVDVKEVPSSGAIHPKTVFFELNRCFPGDTLFTTGCGNNQI